MKIGIQRVKNSFSEHWIDYCKKNNIEFKTVNAYNSNIIAQLADCDIFMWHHSHINYKDVLFAKQLTYSLQMAGKQVFPNFNTSWHFDDKVGQKYLLEAIDAPLVKSYVFYTKDQALQWAKEITFPKVFKLRGGAGSDNVMLVKTRNEANSLIKRAFNHGFKQYNASGNLKERWRKFRLGKTDLLDVLKGIVRFVYPTNFAKMRSNEKGYVYFQDFIPDNKFDIRVVVIGDKAFALKRLVRKNDFRASGGGSIIYNKTEIDERCVQIAFDTNEKINSQSIAYDFVFDKNNDPLIVEISYGYSVDAYDSCEGYWTKDLVWHAGTNFDFCGWMIELLLDVKRSEL